MKGPRQPSVSLIFRYYELVESQQLPEKADLAQDR